MAETGDGNEDDVEEGLDTEEEAERQEPLDITRDERRLVTQPYDLSVSSLLEDISEKRLLLELEYQRDYVWDDAKASRLVESLLLNVPIPVCYFAENEDGTLEAIDGQQRLRSIQRFVRPRDEGDRLVLRGLPVLSELEGGTFADLAQRDQRRILSRTIRCVVITEESHPDIKFDVFERLNTGAARLSDQELRNCIYRGAFNEAMRSGKDHPPFQAMLNGQLVRRKGDAELVLRFVALADRLKDYKPPLRQFLNEYMREHREDAAKVVPLIDEFKRVVGLVYEVFGVQAFRRMGQGGGRNINKAVFDAVMLSCHLADPDALKANRAEAVQALNTLLADPDFDALIGRATADRQRMFGRVEKLSERLVAAGIPSRFRDVLPSE
jgi:hypothetical protein